MYIIVDTDNRVIAAADRSFGIFIDHVAYPDGTTIWEPNLEQFQVELPGEFRSCKYLYVDGVVSANPSWTAPPARVTTRTRKITAGEFVKLGMIVNFAGMNAAITAMPSFQILMNKYVDFAGLDIHDAKNDYNPPLDYTPTLKSALDAIVAGGFYTEEQRADFLSVWDAMFVETVAA